MYVCSYVHACMRFYEHTCMLPCVCTYTHVLRGSGGEEGKRRQLPGALKPLREVPQTFFSLWCLAVDLWATSPAMISVALNCVSTLIDALTGLLLGGGGSLGHSWIWPARRPLSDPGLS